MNLENSIRYRMELAEDRTDPVIDVEVAIAIAVEVAQEYFTERTHFKGQTWDLRKWEGSADGIAITVTTKEP